MRRLRKIVKRAIPSSLLYTLRDFKYIDIPQNYDGSSQGFRGVNIVRSHYYPKATIYFLPDRPLPGLVGYKGAIAYKLCRLLGYGITTNALHRYEKNALHRYDVVFKYSRATYSDALSSDQFEVGHVINGGNTDIGKRAVNTAFNEVFDYALGVDPTTYDGAIVVKSNLNSTHDGYVVQGPLDPADVQAEYAYQRAIDNTVPDQDLVLDYRVPVHGDQIPLVYLKYRPVESRFSNRSTRVVIQKPAEVFSDGEIDRIYQFARHMGVDFGEFDVLRDKDGRIYVVDVNPAPWGPPNGLAASDRKRALAQMGMTFSRLIRTHAIER